MTPAAALVLDLVEQVWNGGAISRLGEYFADPFEHDGAPTTVAELLEWHRDDAQTWAGTTYAVLDCVADDASVALRWQASATHTGPWGPVPATGRRIDWVGAHFFRVENGRIVEMHSLADRFGKALQLGVRLSPPSPENDEGAGA